MLEKDNETERLENVKSLLDDIKEYSEDYPDSSLDEYLQMIALYTERESQEVDDVVNLCTIHSAKGLEFDVVFVIGLSEGIFPSERSMAEGAKGLEEERRLAYVAYTRAKKLLYLCESNSFSYVIQASKVSSRFIDEIDERFIEHVDEGGFKTKTSIFDEEVAIVSKKEKPKNKVFRIGDVVIHDSYGEGKIVSVESDILTIAFSYPHGVKQIFASHPSIRKKEKKDYH